METAKTISPLVLDRQLQQKIPGSKFPVTSATPIVSKELQEIGATVPGHELPGSVEEGVEIVVNTLRGPSNTGKSWLSKLINFRRQKQKADQIGGEVREV